MIYYVSDKTVCNNINNASISITYAIVSPLDINETASDAVQTLCALCDGIFNDGEVCVVAELS